MIDFKDFKNMFFPADFKGKFKEIISGIKFNIGFFGRDIDDEKMMQTNLFAVMENKLKKEKA